jgi:squalene-associated FAD-dependent desaturase
MDGATAASAEGASVAVIGGGWAGCAAAVELACAGKRVTLFEAARTLGGRARAVGVQDLQLDNGQHIMLGAYAETLRILRLVGVDTARAMLKLPLQMRYPDTVSGMDFIAPRLPAPLHLLGALLRAKGLAWADKMALARFSTTARWMGWTLYNDCSVTELLERFEQTPRLVQLMWRPLCLAALNTPPDRASAQVFLAVLRDSLGARRHASDMLLPRTDMSALFPQAAARYVEQHGGTVRTGAKIVRLARYRGQWQVDASGAAVGGNWTAYFESVVLACPPAAAASLLEPLALPQPEPGQPIGTAAVAGAWSAAQDLAARHEEPSADTYNPALPALVAQLRAFAYEPIATVYLQYDPALALGLPFYALVDSPATGQWGQFVFDRGQLEPEHAGLLSVVISAAAGALDLDQDVLAMLVASQLATAFHRRELATPAWTRVITEKRATFACTPGLARPANASGLHGLVLAGDYTVADYPATLESAVRSGVAAARLVSGRQ